MSIPFLSEGENEEMSDLISVIVPVFNVEKYLYRCLDSVCGQTYTNLEIIVVDDGSTDQSPDICKKYAKADSRVQVIHKKNGGLSDARNAGLAVATGSYIGFVDSDDWIEPNMYEVLYTLCREHNLDLIAARFCEEMSGKETRETFSNEFHVLQGLDMLRCNLADSPQCIITNSVWDRLYKREVLRGLMFPVGKCYEDICFSAKVFLNSKKCGYLDAGLYHYVIREDSIMGRGVKNQSVFNDNILSDLLPQMKMRADILYSAGFSGLGDRCLYLYLCEILNCMVRLYKSDTYCNQFQTLKHEFYDYRIWMRQYLNRSIKGVRGVLMKISCVSVPLYIMLVKTKRSLIKTTGKGGGIHGKA